MNRCKLTRWSHWPKNMHIIRTFSWSTPERRILKFLIKTVTWKCVFFFKYSNTMVLKQTDCHTSWDIFSNCINQFITMYLLCIGAVYTVLELACVWSHSIKNGFLACDISNFAHSDSMFLCLSTCRRLIKFELVWKYLSLIPFEFRTRFSPFLNLIFKNICTINKTLNYY